MRLAPKALLLSVLSASALAGGTPTWDSAVGAPGIAGIVYALCVYDDGSGSGPALYAGGAFQSAGGVAASNLAKWDGVSWSPVGAGVDDSVHALFVYDDGRGPALYIGGNFAHAGGEPAPALARWNGASFEAVGGGLSDGATGTQFAPIVADMCVQDEDGVGSMSPSLVVAGNFLLAGSTPAQNLARWSNGQWFQIGGGLRHNADAVVVHDDGSGRGPELYVGGSVLILGTFGGFNGIHAGYIGRYGVDGWNTLDGGLNAQALAFAILPHDNRLYMAGNFGGSDSGVNMRGVGNWDGANWHGMAEGLPITGMSTSVFDLGFGQGRQVFAGGHFAMRVWTGSEWQPMPPGMTGGPSYVRALCVYDDGLGQGPALFVAGEFGGVGGNIAAIRGAPHCPGDANGDRLVDFADLNDVLGDFGAMSIPGALAGDLNYDGAADFADLNDVLSGFGATCP